MRGNNRHGIVVQERDRRLLQQLALLRVIDREQAKIVAGFSSTTKVNTRLLELTQARLLRRFFLGSTSGGKKAIYSLSAKGAALVGAPVRGPRRRNNETLVTDSLVLHRLATNDVYCALRRTLQNAATTLIRWLSFSGPLKPGVRLIPDGYFELSTPSGTIAAFLEIDLGHERLKVWQGKIKHYLHFALSGDYERRFGQEQFRVLVVANSERRLHSIRRVVRSSTQKIFWFATIESIRSQGLLAAIWLRPEGDSCRSLFPTDLLSS